MSYGENPDDSLEENPEKEEKRATTFAPAPLLSKERMLDPYPWYDEMRENEPVRYDELRGVYDVFLHEDVDRVLSDDEYFYRKFANQSVAQGHVNIEGFGQTMVNSEPPEHTEYRGMVSDVFTPGEINLNRDAYKERATRLLDEALSGSDEMDFVADFAVPFPILNVADMLGVDENDRAQIREWSVKMSGNPDELTQSAVEEMQEEHIQAVIEMSEYFVDLIEERQDDPQDDLVTKIAHADPDGLSLDIGERVSLCNLLLLGGNVTTTAFLTDSLWTFLEEGVYSDIRGGSLDLKPALEEVLRYRSPVQTIARTAKQDVELKGVEIPEEASVQAQIGSANHDGRVFENPDTFVPERSPNRHIAFGSGIHFCLGAPLARLEAEVAFEALFERVEDTTIATDELEPHNSSFILSLEELPVSTTPAQ